LYKAILRHQAQIRCPGFGVQIKKRLNSSNFLQNVQEI